MGSDYFTNVTGMVLTFNEAPNIDRVLSKLDRLRRVVVVDSGSDDGTLDIVAKHPNVDVISRRFDTFAGQCNFGLLEGGILTDWVLSLDADYVLSDELIDELSTLSPADDVAGFRAAFKYSIFGRPIRCGVYPPVVVLFRREGARYVDDGHAHRVVVPGHIEDLSGVVFHDDRKPLSRWLDSQRSYARREADHLERDDRGALRWQDRIRLMIGIAPPMMFLYVFVVRLGFLDGRFGLYYAMQRAFAELLLSVELLDRRLRRVIDR